MTDHPALTPARNAVLIPTTTPGPRYDHRLKLAVAASTEIRRALTGGGWRPAAKNTPESLLVTLAIGHDDADALTAVELGYTTPAERSTRTAVLDQAGALALHRHLTIALERAGVLALPATPDPDADVTEALADERAQGETTGYEGAVEALRAGRPGQGLSAAALAYVRGLDRLAAAVIEQGVTAALVEQAEQTAAATTPAKTWTGFARDGDGSLPLRTAVFQALGAASVAWESMAGAGVFQDGYARAIGDDLLQLVERAVEDARVDGWLNGLHEPDRSVPDVQPLSPDLVLAFERDAREALAAGRGPRGAHVAVLELVATIREAAEKHLGCRMPGESDYSGPGRLRLGRTNDNDELVLAIDIEGHGSREVFPGTRDAAALGWLLLRCAARDGALAGARRVLRRREGAR